MSIVAYTDPFTYEVLDDALEQLARHRDLSLNHDSGLLSALASLAQQLDEMIEQAIAETDLGSQVTIDDIAALRGIDTAEAHRRYRPEPQPF
jgi:hypothetical protein